MRMIVLLAALLVALPSSAEEATYRPGGHSFEKEWHRFYELGFHEPELDDPLIERGPAMVPAICAAVAHTDMKYRRYALSALGYIRDSKAIPCLEKILRDTAEEGYFRGDALKAIYRIDQPLGKRYAIEYGDRDSYLRKIADLILRGAIPIAESGLSEE